MAGAGLKKCRPSTRSGRDESAASRVTDSALVPVARIGPGCTIPSSSRKTCCLISYARRRPRSPGRRRPRPARSVKVRNRARTSVRSCSVIRSRCTARAVEASSAATARRGGGLADVDADDLAAGRGQDLGDAGAHGAEADDGDRLERGQRGVGQGSGHRGTPGMRVTTGTPAYAGDARGGRAHRVRRRSAGVVPGCERTRPVSSARACTRPMRTVRSDRPCPGAGSYCGTRGTEPTLSRRLRHQATARRCCEWVTRSSELNRWVTSAPAL